ncbi:MAG: hypothetical protein OEY88_10845 [Candidatus Bathyarchaeota archaeon]|nr:hypothetical protein [Candidatus Bathyarchaeota archaeon]
MEFAGDSGDIAIGLGCKPHPYHYSAESLNVDMTGVDDSPG